MRYLFAFVFFLLFSDYALGGKAVIFQGSFVKALKDDFKLSETAYILTGTVDPTASAVDAPLGSLFIKTDTGDLYQKLDAGSSTNWERVLANVLEDTTPQLGGNLDLNGFDIVDGATRQYTRVDKGAFNESLFLGQAGNASITGADNVVIGSAAGSALTSGIRNVFIGNQAGQITSSGGFNVFIGHQAGEDMTTSGNSVYIGASTGQNMTAINNAVGQSALLGAPGATGSANSAFGNSALNAIDTGSRNTAFGNSAGDAVTDGDDNIFIGDQSGQTITTGSGNILIGRNAETDSATASNRIGIGENVVVDTDNMLRLGSPSISLIEVPTSSAIVAESGTVNFNGGQGWNGSTSGTLTHQPAAVTTSYTLNWPAAQGAAGTHLENDGSGNLTWSAAGAFTDPMTTRGDIIYRDSTNTTDRLAVGAAGTIKISDGTDLINDTSPTFTDQVTVDMANDSILSIQPDAATDEARILMGQGSDTDHGEISYMPSGPAEMRFRVNNQDVGIWTDGELAVENGDGISAVQIESRAADPNDISELRFADSGDSDVGYIRYDHGGNQMQFRVNGNSDLSLRIESSGHAHVEVDNGADCGIGSLCSNDGEDAGTGETCGANCDACSVVNMKWLRVGAVVNISFRVQLDPTSSGLSTACDFDPPVSTTFSNNFQSTGICNRVVTGSDTAGVMTGDSAGNEIRITIPEPTHTTSQDYVCSGQFSVL